jgi:DNA-binding NarL/FixJ family response regulator
MRASKLGMKRMPAISDCAETHTRKAAAKSGSAVSVKATWPTTPVAEVQNSAAGGEHRGCVDLFKTSQATVVDYGLTAKELQLLELLSFGYENGDIAEHFKTSRQAVKNMLRTINLKLGADNRTHAVAISFRNGLLPLRP